MMDVIEKVLRLITYSQELGLDLKTEEDRFKWFLASILFAKRISSEVAKRTYREFEKEGIVTPESITEAGWDKLVEVLDSGGYVRYDFSTASNLLEIAASLREKYGSLEALYAQSKDSRDLEKRLLEFKGVGPTTVNIFLRELKAVWGKAKDDISILMLYVAMDKYLKSGGKLGFLITQSVFKTAGAGQGLRRFQLGNGEYVQVQHVDDMVELQPFEGASNRTSVVILQKGRPTKYPMPSYLYWKKTVRGKSIAIDSSLDDVLQMTERKQFAAEPVDEKDPTSAWLTGKPKAIKAVKKILGQSDYVAHAGVYSGGANGVYWVDIIDKRPDGLVVVSNITKGTRIKVENIQMAIEPDLLYPLMRGRDVKRWCAEPSAHIIFTHMPGMRLNAIPEDEMKTDYPKTYLYLKRFEAALRERAAYRRYFRSDDPFYSMFDIGDYTFAPYKVVWLWIATGIRAAVVSESDGKSVCPEHNTSFLDSWREDEVHFICALLNSTIGDFSIRTFYSGGGGGIASPAVLQKIQIPKFDSTKKVHQELSGLSQNAHYATEIGDEVGLAELEQRIDELAAQIWGLTGEELKEIQESLAELK